MTASGSRRVRASDAPLVMGETFEKSGRWIALVHRHYGCTLCDLGFEQWQPWLLGNSDCTNRHIDSSDRD